MEHAPRSRNRFDLDQISMVAPDADLDDWPGLYEATALGTSLCRLSHREFCTITGYVRCQEAVLLRWVFKAVPESSPSGSNFGNLPLTRAGAGIGLVNWRPN